MDGCSSIAAERVSDESETWIDLRTTSLESSQPRLRKKEGFPSELRSRILNSFQKMNCLCEWDEDKKLKFLRIWMLSIDLFILERERHGGEARLDSTVSTKECSTLGTDAQCHRISISKPSLEEAIEKSSAVGVSCPVSISKRLKRSDPGPANNDELYSDLKFCHSMISVALKGADLKLPLFVLS